MTLGSFVKPFPAITQGELEPQFASKGFYFEQNIKKVCRCHWEVIKNTWEWYLSYIIIHVPSEKIWKHLGQFGGLDIKTSQEPKLWKNWKIGHFGKNLKRDITGFTSSHKSTRNMKSSSRVPKQINCIGTIFRNKN